MRRSVAGEQSYQGPWTAGSAVGVLMEPPPGDRGNLTKVLQELYIGHSAAVWE